MMLFSLLNVGSGIFWALAYVLILRRGFLDRTYGVPLVALCGNLSWEFIFAVVYPSMGIHAVINGVWLLLDCVIVYQVLRYGPAEDHPLFGRFYLLFTVTLCTAFGLILFLIDELQDFSGIYTGLGNNLLMSVLFSEMLLRRGSARGQSLYIALSKMIGTVLASLSLLWWPHFLESALLQYLAVTVFLFDLIYLMLVYHQARSEGIEPWKRV